MKLNNKGFAISTILYGLLALLILIVMLIFQVMRTNNNNSKELGASVQEDLSKCKVQRKIYNNCPKAELIDSTSSCYKADENYKACLTSNQ